MWIYFVEAPSLSRIPDNPFVICETFVNFSRRTAPGNYTPARMTLICLALVYMIRGWPMYVSTSTFHSI